MGKKKESVNHHYVPQVIIKQWANNSNPLNKKVWVYTVPENGKNNGPNPALVHPKRFFYAPYLNTINGTPSMETHLEPLESVMGTIIKKIIAQKQLTSEDIQWLKIYAAITHSRHKRASNFDWSAFEKITRKEVTNNPFANTIPERALRIFIPLDNYYDLRILTINKTNTKSFILPEYPQIFIMDEDTRLIDHHLLPITPKHCIHLFYKKSYQENVQVEVEDRCIYSINSVSLREVSNKFVYDKKESELFKCLEIAKANINVTARIWMP